MQEIRRGGYFLIGLMLVALTCSFVWRPAPPPQFKGLPAIPMVVGSYTGHDVPVDAITKGALASAEILSRDYKSESGETINLTLIGGTNRSALHDPRSCLVGAGWRIDLDQVESLPADSDTRVRSCVAEWTNQAGNSSSVDMTYLYVSHGKVIASATEIRIALLEAALFDQSNSPVYFIRFTTPRPSGNDAVAEHARLLSFIEQFWQKVRPEILDGGRR